MKQMKKFFSTILHSWGSDTPQEVIWGLNDLLKWAKSKGFQTTLEFDDVCYYNDEPTQTKVSNDNETLVKELSDFFEENMK
jgi:hypothetical protein